MKPEILDLLYLARKNSGELIRPCMHLGQVFRADMIKCLPEEANGNPAQISTYRSIAATDLQVIIKQG